MKILLIDETIGYLHPMLEDLLAAGYEVELARAGSTAVDLARAHRPDLIIIDTDSPKDSDTVKRDLVMAGQYAPVLVLSSEDSEALRDLAFLSGCIDYVYKGTHPSSILERVQRACTLGAIENSVRKTLMKLEERDA